MVILIKYVITYIVDNVSFYLQHIQHMMAELRSSKRARTRVQPLSTSWVPEPKLCVEASLTISCRYLSTSRTSSSSSPTSEVTFHVVVFRGPGRQGPRPRLLPVPQCTRPPRLLLWVVSLLATKELPNHLSDL